MSATAELLADRGAAAESEDLFRSRPFLDAEGVTHTLRIEAGDATLVAPLIVREIPGTPIATRSPPTAIRAFRRRCSIDPPIVGKKQQQALDPAAVDWSATGLVSLFVRHTLGEPPLAGAAERNVVQIADPALPAKSRGSDRNRINKNRRAGYGVGSSPARRRRRSSGPASSPPTTRRCIAPAPPSATSSTPPTSTASSSPTTPGWRSRRHPAGGRRRLAGRAQRRLPPLLPQRQRRRAAARLADEERRRGAGRARDRAGPAAQPRRRPLARRRAGGVQARLRQPRAALARPPRSSATARPTTDSRPGATRPASSPPTVRRL